MPTYEYHCEKCNQSFDAFQSMKDDPFKTCPQKFCKVEPWGEGTVKRQLGTGAGLIFKGSGFYITDYRSAGYKDAAKKESGAAEAAKKDSGGTPPATTGDSSKTTPKTPPKPPSTGSSGSSSSSGSESK
jgi:putative FmdB family regulatory protein